MIGGFASSQYVAGIQLEEIDNGWIVSYDRMVKNNPKDRPDLRATITRNLYRETAPIYFAKPVRVHVKTRKELEEELEKAVAAAIEVAASHKQQAQMHAHPYPDQPEGDIL